MKRWAVGMWVIAIVAGGWTVRAFWSLIEVLWTLPPQATDQEQAVVDQFSGKYASTWYPLALNVSHPRLALVVAAVACVAAGAALVLTALLLRRRVRQPARVPIPG